MPNDREQEKNVPPEQVGPLQRIHANRSLRDAIVEGDSYALLLFALATLFVLIPVLGSSPGSRLVINGIVSTVLLLGLHTSHVRHRRFQVAVGFAVLNVGAATLGLLSHEEIFVVIATISAGVLLLVTPVVVLRRIMAHPIVATETILGAICVYVMIGLAFAFIYYSTALLTHADVLKGVEPGTAPNYLYFSYITMTTVGYGDLTPATKAMQSMAIVEALLGQLFLATTIARLVGTLRQQRPFAEGEGEHGEEVESAKA